MYKLHLTLQAENQIKKLPFKLQDVMINSLQEIIEYPEIGKPLKRELTGYFSFRIGVHRIIYKVNKKEKIIEVLSAGHRTRVYI